MEIVTNTLFQDVKQSVSLLDVFRDNGIKVDRYNKCCCPFHSEKTASMSIKNNRYKCFGCGVSGDIFDFIQAHYGLDKFNAAKYLIDSYHLPIDTAEKKDPVKLKQMKAEAERRRAERAEAEQAKAYSQYAHRRILSFYHWLKEQERTDLINNLIAWCDRQIDRLCGDNYLINFDIDVRLTQMYRQTQPQPELPEDYFTGLVMAAAIGFR